LGKGPKYPQIYETKIWNRKMSQKVWTLCSRVQEDVEAGQDQIIVILKHFFKTFKHLRYIYVV